MADEAKQNARSDTRGQTDEFLAGLAPGLERLVNSRSFGVMIAQAASNAVALSRIGNEVMDLALRNARIAGRADVVSLHRQLARTEDKLEVLLATVERLEGELAAERTGHDAVNAGRGGRTPVGAEPEVDESGTTSTAPLGRPRRTPREKA